MSTPPDQYYDGATHAPDLKDCKGRNSAAFPIHDLGWVTGVFDDGSPISFRHNNDLMTLILILEGHPMRGVKLYSWGVNLPGMEEKWINTHHPDGNTKCDLNLALSNHMRG